LGEKNSWIGVRLEGVKSNRDAIGAKLTMRIGERKFVRWVTGGGSYLSSHDKRVLFGLGKWAAGVDLEILWPSGALQTVKGLKPGRYHRILEG
jgi:hypothetical protein